MSNTKQSNINGLSAFTLLEMAIVIVIIGLIVGGIMSGRALIRTAELRTIYADVEKYLTAINNFETKYESLPGDIWNATDIWGAQDGGDGLGTDCTCSASTTKATCNGNGDGQIGNIGGDYEIFRMWQHLVNADYIEGNFTGIQYNYCPSADVSIEPGTNVPAGKINGTGFVLVWTGSVTSSSVDYFTGENYHHVINYTRVTNPTYHYPYHVKDAITPEEAYSIDAKFDDGRPGLGKIMGSDNTSGCSTSGTAATAEYALTETEPKCGLTFVTGF